MSRPGSNFDALPERERPRYIMVSDFQTFELRDLDEREVVAFPLANLSAHVEAFGFILGVQRRTFRDQDPANIKAAELVGRLHDTLAEAGHQGHDLERFLVRVVFCMFADDTGCSSRATSSSTSSRRGPARTGPISGRGWRNCSKCSTLRRTNACVLGAYRVWCGSCD